MALRPIKGNWVIKSFPKKASTTITKGDLLQFDTGTAAPATTQSKKHMGIALQAIASTDSDFASTTRIKVAVPTEPSAEFIADVTGTLVTTSLGLQYDMSAAGTVNQGGTTYKVVTCTGYVSATKGRFILNSNLAFADTTWD